MGTWRLLRMGPRPATENMAVDAVLLAAQRKDPAPTLRLYEWDGPALTFGYFQEIRTLVDLAACRRRGIQLARRPTGGGVVVHDGSLTFSLVLPRNTPGIPEAVEDLYRRLAATTCAALAAFGVSANVALEAHADVLEMPEWCPLRPVAGDVLVGQRKIAGGALRQTPTGRLYQAYLVLEMPSRATLDVAAEPIHPDVSQFTTTLRDTAERSVNAAEVKTALIDAFARGFGIDWEEASLSVEEEQRVTGAIETLFGRKEWLFGDRQARRRLRRRLDGLVRT